MEKLSSLRGEKEKREKREKGSLSGGMNLRNFLCLVFLLILRRLVGVGVSDVVDFLWEIVV